jgi:hydrogenase nickel incorporation protein HypA/HybF
MERWFTGRPECSLDPNKIKGETMHELSLAIGLLERVLDQARLGGLTSVSRIEVEIGALQAVEPELLHEAFRAVAEGGPASGAEMIHTMVPAKARCRACATEFSPSFTYYVCPQCHQADVEILAGRNLILTSLTGEAPGA